MPEKEVERGRISSIVPTREKQLVAGNRPPEKAMASGKSQELHLFMLCEGIRKKGERRGFSSGNRREESSHQLRKNLRVHSQQKREK